jgi:hypothetical protein
LRLDRDGTMMDVASDYGCGLQPANEGRRIRGL